MSLTADKWPIAADEVALEIRRRRLPQTDELLSDDGEQIAKRPLDSDVGYPKSTDKGWTEYETQV